MATADIDGVTIAYEIVGEGRPWVITPGGRFSKDTPGVRQLAEELARHGQRVLIWDRPNTGASSVCFEGASESQMQSDHLARLLVEVDMAPAVIMGGSGGARVSLLTAANHPEVAERLAMLWISGGVYGLMNLAIVYCGESIRAAWTGGMEAVTELPGWAEVLERNPSNRDRFLRMDPRAFITVLEQWMRVYYPGADVAVPGLSVEACKAVTVPTLVFRSGASDPHHPRETSEQVHGLIAGSRLVEPPWGDTEWNERSAASRDGRGFLFERWPLLAPQLLEFAG
ncbi:MAG TPA: alpha/beta hydrolase [Acidimicrobiales bacterium]|nr:alpha/beta hydrolase [Acidimicrobiales bacterium]